MNEIQVNKDGKPEKVLNNQSLPVKKKKRKIFRKFFLFIFLLFIALIIFMQTSFFKNWALKYAIKKVNEALYEKDAYLTVESIEGKITGNFTLYNATLTMKGDTLAGIKRINIEYDLLNLLKNKIEVHNIVIDTLKANLTKVKDKQGNLLWNYEYLLQTELPPDTIKKDFNWKIICENLEIHNGDIKSLAVKKDELPLGSYNIPNVSRFNLDTLDISRLNLKLSGEYSKDEISADIKNISFNTNSVFNLHRLSLKASIDNKNLAKISDLFLETDKSKVEIKTASLENFNPLKSGIDYEEFKGKSFGIDITTNKFDFDDLTYFLPDINFMDGAVYFRLIAKGNYADFKIDELNFTLPRGTKFDIDGRVKNLQMPEHLYLDVACRNADINPAEVKKVLPGLDIPDYSHLGIVNTSFKFIGEPLKFNAEAKVNSSAGSADVKGYLDITRDELIYDGRVSAQNVNIGKIIKNDKLISNITGEFIASGKGVDYNRMVSSLTYKINNTSIYDQKIENSYGTIKASSGIFNVDLFYKSNTGSVKAAGDIVLRDLNNIGYNIKGDVRNADISSLTKNNEDKSNLNFSFDLSGKGTNPDLFAGNLNFVFDNSLYNNYLIPATPMNISFTYTDTARYITATSEIFDLKASGNFKIAELPSIFTANIEKMTEEIEKNISLDSSGFSRQSELTDFRIRSYTKNISYDTDLRYSLKIKSLLPLHILIKDSSLVFKCDIRGRVLNNSNSFLFTTQGRFEDFKYRDSVLNFDRGIVRVFLKDDLETQMPFSYLSDFNTRFSNLNFNGTHLDTLDIDLQTNTLKPKLRIFAKGDTAVSLFLNADVNISNNSYGLFIDTLTMAYDIYKLNNAKPLLINYLTSDTGDLKRHLNFTDFILEDGEQRLSIDGDFSFNGNSNITLTGNRLSIAKFQKYLNHRIDKSDLVKGNVRRVLLNYKGTMEDPVLSMEVNSDFITMQKNKFGRLDALFSYENNNLKPLVTIYNTNNAGYLSIEGSMPYKNPLLQEDSVQIRENILESIVALNITSKNFQIDLLEKILPIFTNLHGNLNGTLNIDGQVMNPMLSGGLTLKDGSFNLNMTGVNYNFTGDLKTDKQKLNLVNFAIVHPLEPEKQMELNGYIDFTNLTLNDMEFKIRGETKLLDETVAQNDMGIYGDVTGRTGLRDLVIKGNPSSLYMTGDIDIVNGNILIIPQTKVAYNIYSDNFLYKVLLDSSLSKDSTYIIKYTDSLSTFEKLRLDPFQRYFYSINDSVDTKKDEGIFKYYIKLRTLNDIYGKLVVEEKTGQEFSGYVSANVTFDNLETENLSTRGRIDISKNSYYKFYKNFNATGYALFTGSVINPELYIKANYSVTSTNPLNSGTRTVDIDMDVNGSALNPLLSFDVSVDGSPIGGTNPSEDAISFIVFGRFKDELNADQRLSYISSVGANVGTSFASNYVSDFVNNYLPFIVKTDISYKDSQSGTFAENADVRFTAQLAGATIVFGGQLLRDLSNTNFLIEYPLNNIFGINNFSRNLILQVERYIDPFSQNNYDTENRTGGLLLYRIKF